MILSPGGPTKHGKWFFVSGAGYSARHTLGSLNYYKGNTEAVFSGVGEISRGPWRDGSPVPCDAPPPAPPCFHDPYANYDIAEISFDSGTTWSSLVQGVGTDDWHGSFAFGFGTYYFETSCDPSTHSQKMFMHNTSFPTLNYFYGSESYVPGYPTVWNVPTVVGNPSAWDGRTVKFRTRCSGNFAGGTVASHNNLSSIVLSMPAGMRDGDSIVIAYFQNGTDVSGGVLAAPGISGGPTLLHGAPGLRAFYYFQANRSPLGTVTLSGIGAADLQDVYLANIRTAPGASVRDNVFRDAQAAATALSSGTVTLPSGDPGAILWVVSQFRNNPASAPGATYSGATGLTLFSSMSHGVVGGTPVFEMLGSAELGKGATAPGSYAGALTSNRSYQWNSAIFAVR